MEPDRVALAFALTLFAGLATGVGSAIALLARRTSTRLLSVALGFSAGVMIYVSFVEILAKGRLALDAAWGPRGGGWGAAAAFFAGMALVALIDRLVPAWENPHEPRRLEQMELGRPPPERLMRMRMGLVSAFAIAAHNFPEGIAAFTAAMDEPKIGATIAIAIGIHNVPEGIAVAIPIYYATGSRRKAFTWSFLSGLAEPLGAIIGFAILMPFFGDAVRGLLFAGVAGIMVFVSLDELLPTAREYGEHHLAVYGLVSGMALMAASLLLVN
jgi:ZIP family zinc transporter